MKKLTRGQVVEFARIARAARKTDDKLLKLRVNSEFINYYITNCANSVRSFTLANVLETALQQILSDNPHIHIKLQVS